MKVLATILLAWFSVGAFATPQITYSEPFPELLFEQPVQITHAGDGSGRLYVVQQNGQVMWFSANSTSPSARVFFDINRVSDNRLLTGGEQGLLGIAFDPDYSKNGFVYVNYTADSPRRTVISRLEVLTARHQVIPGSEKILLEIEQDFANHNGGQLLFGPDGNLYIGMGDGGSSGDPNNRAQDGQSLLGKMLRVNKLGRAPLDNPFVSDRSVRNEIWALGLRNPWRFSFDRKTGVLWAADVGQNAVEEVNIIEAGGNYGWRWFEGSSEYNPDDRAAETVHQRPIFEYPHSEGRSITGGVVYRGSINSSLYGWYVFGDFVSGAMWALNADGNYEVVSLPTLPNPSSFGEDEAGNIYVTSYQGRIFRIIE